MLLRQEVDPKARRKYLPTMEQPTVTLRHNPKDYLRIVLLSSLLLLGRNKTLVTILLIAFAFGTYGNHSGLLTQLGADLGFLMIFTIGFCGFLYFRMKSRIRKEPELLGPYHVTLEEDGIRWVTRDVSVLHRWKTMSTPWKLFGKLFVFRGYGAQVFPREAFADEERFHQWEKIIREKISSASA